MAQPKLPLKVRVGVRDHFDAPTSSVQKAFSSLKRVVGHEVSCTADWEKLWAKLGSSFADMSAFAPNIASVVAIWCSVLQTRLEDNRFASWTEALLDRLEPVHAIKLTVVTSSVVLRPQTTFAHEYSCFGLNLPTSSAFSPSTCTAGLEADLHNLFTSRPATANAGSPANRDEEWAEIDEAGESQSLPIPLRSSELKPDILPIFETLSSPDLLLITLTPYILHVTSHSTSKVVIQGTHAPSLQLLSQYLQRWIKKNHQNVNKTPFLRITLSESNFGFGSSHDTLTLEPYDYPQNQFHVKVNPTLVLAFVEGILGYQRLAGVAQDRWEFRRDVGFK